MSEARDPEAGVSGQQSIHDEPLPSASGTRGGWPIERNPL
jgi:hypothetical protein